MRTIQIRLPQKLVEKAQNLVNIGLYNNTSEVIRDSLRRLVTADSFRLNKRNFLILYSADLHGNIEQYKKFLARAFESSADAVIVGGDLAPKNAEDRTVTGQRRFFQQKLFPLISNFRRISECKLFLLMGNDDFASNEPFLRQNQKIGFTLLGDKPAPIFQNYSVVGYPFVPLTPFKYKDWEKPDLIRENELETRKDVRLDGIKTKGKKVTAITIDIKNRDQCIEKDLFDLARKVSHHNTIYVIHAPPHNTALDILSTGEHVGSRGVLKFIKTNQPILTLHGHIHETVASSKKFKEEIGATMALTPGNSHLTSSVAALLINLFDPKNAQRIIIT